ncbi:MAG TPA: acetoin utilization protein AcuC, partial [Anaerolineae bacterium]|nr:acetoin utilization protein AcuC [Anaerolineae bacterium]
VRAFHDMGLPWVALGGGGYNVHTVARAWTLAYGIMSEQEFPDEIPASYAQRYGDRRLHDRGGPRLDPRDAARARAHAERQVAALQEALGF